MKVPNSAFSFIDSESQFKIDEDQNVHIVGLSGKPLDHWYWGKFSIDLKGMSADKKFYPILSDHNTSAKIGFSGKPVIENNQLVHKSIQFLDTPSALEFKELSKQGFPFEASIYGKPTELKQISDKEEVEVNGYKLRGPAYVWTKWVYKETSAVVFGADADTKSKVLSESDEQIEVKLIESNKEKEVEIKMTYLEKLKAEDPEGYQKLMDETKVAIEKEIAEKVKSEVESKFVEEVKTLATELTSANEQILKFAKNEEIRKEKEMKADADQIFNDKLAESTVPKRLHDKVKSLVSYGKFIKEGELDVETFSIAVDAEIKDWVDSGVTETVLGTSFNQKEAASEGLSEENDKWLAKMRKFAGEKE